MSDLLLNARCALCKCGMRVVKLRTAEGNPVHVTCMRRKEYADAGKPMQSRLTWNRLRNIMANR